ncbi:MAG: hypothetical protein KGI98_00785 [Euryarchaeota archaeon]|nr:hypothetical protein [Euryarchaeota archaeon]
MKREGVLGVVEASGRGDWELAGRGAPLVQVAPSYSSSVPRHDWARGRGLLAGWAIPIGLIFVGSSGPSLGLLKFIEGGTLMVLGTAVFGLICLTNALRCGRTHCWVDGVSLPVLAVGGALDLVGWVRFSWNTYGAVLWAIVVASFLVECLAGDYLRPLVGREGPAPRT